MVDLLAPFLIRAYVAVVLSGVAASAGSVWLFCVEYPTCQLRRHMPPSGA